MRFKTFNPLGDIHLADIYIDFYEEVYSFKPLWVNADTMTEFEAERLLNQLADIRLSFDTSPFAKESASIIEFEKLVTYLMDLRTCGRATVLRSLAMGHDLAYVEQKFHLPNGYLIFSVDNLSN